jgi:mono/diheme cytochrome c family protein
MNKIVFPACILAMLLVGSIILNTSFKSSPPESEMQMPENIKKIIDQSCFQCHNIDSKNDKAKEALDFKSFNELGKVRKITKLRDMAEVVEKGEMPPKKFLENNPDKKLTNEQVKVLADWAKKEASALIGN